MRKLIGALLLIIIITGIGYYVYTHGWKRPESFRSLFSSTSSDPRER